MRLFAALHVVLFHMSVTGMLPGGPWWFRNFAGIGCVGVNFFFVLSGFILVYTYSGPPLNARRFWKARFARIYPAYVLSLIVPAPFFFFAVRSLDLPFLTWSMQHLVWACILTIGLMQAWVPQAALTWNAVCWSLSVESFFYFLFPTLLRLTEKLSERRLALWIACFWLLSVSFPLAYIVAHPDGADKINSPETNLFWKNSVISTGILSPAFAAIICGAARRPGWTSFLEARWLVLPGNASYSLYLLHSAVISSTFDAIPHWPRWTRVAAPLAAAIGSSLIAYRFVEEPARRPLRPAR